MEIACLVKDIKALAVKRLSGRPKRRELRIDAVLALCSLSILGNNLNATPQAQGKSPELARLSGIILCYSIPPSFKSSQSNAAFSGYKRKKIIKLPFIYIFILKERHVVSL